VQGARYSPWTVGRLRESPSLFVIPAPLASEARKRDQAGTHAPGSLFREIYRSVRRHRTRQCRELLRVANWLPPKHPLIAEIITPWTEQVKEATKGRVMMQVLPSPVGPPPALTSRLVASWKGSAKCPSSARRAPASSCRCCRHWP
jgi:hypothetical protein